MEGVVAGEMAVGEAAVDAVSAAVGDEFEAAHCFLGGERGSGWKASFFWEGEPFTASFFFFLGCVCVCSRDFFFRECLHTLLGGLWLVSFFFCASLAYLWEGFFQMGAGVM